MCAVYLENVDPDGPKAQRQNRQLDLGLDPTDSSPNELVGNDAKQSDAGKTKGSSPRTDQSFRAWLADVDQNLIEEAGLTKGLFQRNVWTRLFRKDLTPSEASCKAISMYKQGSTSVEKRRRWLLTLLSAEHVGLLMETIEKAPEAVIRDGLRLSGPTQQKRIERLLEQRVAQLAS